MKQCSRCKKDKPLTEYYKQPNTKDKLMSYCKACNKESSYRYRSRKLSKCWWATDYNK